MNRQTNYLKRIANAITQYTRNNGRKPRTIDMSLNDWMILREQISAFNALPFFHFYEVKVEWSSTVIDDNTVMMD